MTTVLISTTLIRWVEYEELLIARRDWIFSFQDDEDSDMVGDKCDNNRDG